MGILSGNPQDEPMHYGEVFGLWSYVMAGNKMVGNYQMLLNHVGDDDLKKLLRESIEKCQDEIKQVSTILKENGVAAPPASLNRRQQILTIFRLAHGFSIRMWRPPRQDKMPQVL